MARKWECYSCGSWRSDTPFPERKATHQPRLCCTCFVEWPRELERQDRCHERRNDAMRTVVSRKKYRANLRVRSMQPQLDLVDAIMARP